MSEKIPLSSEPVSLYMRLQSHGVLEVAKHLSYKPWFFHISKYLSIILEIMLYLLFASVILIAIIIPSGFIYFEPLDIRISLEFPNKNIVPEIFTKLLIAFLSLPILFLGICIRKMRYLRIRIRLAALANEKLKHNIETLQHLL